MSALKLFSLHFLKNIRILNIIRNWIDHGVMSILDFQNIKVILNIWPSVGSISAGVDHRIGFI